MRARYIVTYGLLLTLLALMGTAFGQDYDSVNIGSSIPLWMEHTAAVNNDGDVVWTDYNYGTNTATGHVSAGGTVQPLDPGPGANGVVLTQSYATDIASTDNTIVGYGGNNPSLSIREAKLWIAGSHFLVNLHADAPAGYKVSVAESIASGGGSSHVAGWVRARTSSSDFPEPYAWLVSGSNVTGKPLVLRAAETNGFARRVAEADRDGSIWACGAVAASGTYAQAACWDLTKNDPSVVLSGLSGYATSAIERVRTVELDGTKQSIAVGFATDINGDSHPFVYNITEDTLDEDVTLVANGTGMLKDLGVEVWPDAGDEEGLVFYGGMSTTPAYNVLTDAPLSDVQTMRSTYQTKLGTPTSGEWDVCLVDDGLSGANTHQLTVGVSANGKYRLVWSSQTRELTRLERKEKTASNLQVYVRDAEVRTVRGQRKAYSNQAGSTPSIVQYYWAEQAGTTVNGTVMWGDASGCESFDNGGVYKAKDCDDHRTFDLAGSPSQALNFVDVISNVAKTNIKQNALPAGTFVQTALQGSGNVCDVSPVLLASDVERANDFPTATNESGVDWRDCGLSASVQYDTDVMRSLDHCGKCNYECSTAHNTSICKAEHADAGDGRVAGCEIIDCDSGWVDLNGDPKDGCECNDLGHDAPELTAPFVDTNCDGVDGDAANSIFVAQTSASVDDSTCGTRTKPCRTIQYGIGRATSGMDVLVSRGTYNEAITLKNGVSVYGGYDASQSWSRSESYIVETLGTVTSGHGWGVRGTNISAETILNQITFVAPAATSAGASSIGIACTTCNGLHVAYATVEAKAGQAGTNGVNGGAGQNGVRGNNGNDRNGGTGASRSCSTGSAAKGGNGGLGGDKDFWSSGGRRGSNGDAGQRPWTPNSANGGAGGTYSGVGSGSAGDGGGGGSVTTAAGVGVNGIAGGRSVLNGWLLEPSDGVEGYVGNHGGAGGGGGGGAGNLVDRGGGGGGGGSGGCGGLPGNGGQGGGSSVAVLLGQSSSAHLSNTVLRTANGGKGGNGGNGGNGGSGGPGGTGVKYKSDGRGGNGGSGGAGGRGGHGGGGAGGDSVCILTYGGTVPAGNRGGTTCSNGSAGGAGTSSGNSGPAGQTGLIVNR